MSSLPVSVSGFGSMMSLHALAEAPTQLRQMAKRDAVLQDLPINAFRAVKQGTTQVTATFPTEEKYGFAMAKDNVDLLDAVNESLNEFRAGGVYDEIYQKYFGTPGASE